MKTLAFLLAVACVIIGAMYCVLPGGSLPAFMPGYAADSTRIHMLHGFAAVTAAVVFLLIGLSTTAYRQEPYRQEPRSPIATGGPLGCAVAETFNPRADRRFQLCSLGRPKP